MGIYSAPWIATFMWFSIFLFVAVVAYFFIKTKHYAESRIFNAIKGCFAYIGMVLMGLGLLIVVIFSPLIVPVVNFLKFLQQKILSFFISFLPEKVNINGEIVDTYVEPGFYPFFATIDNSTIFFNSSKGVPVDFYYLKIWDPLNNEYSTVQINFFMYEDIKIRLENLDLSISLSCKKNPWNNELYI